MYVKVTNGVAENYSIGQLRKDNPGTSFPKQPSQEALAQWDVYPLKSTPIPAVDHTKNVKEGVPIQQDGEWVQVWDVTQATPQEIETRTQDRARAVRSERDQKLAVCDWTQVSDSPVDKEAWAIYRQALRDIPDQSDFPWVVQWPMQPV
jgi:hypothetical protein